MKSLRAVFFSFAVALSLFAPRADARESARLMALGGEDVAGIIPDPYTDLHLSPVHALDFSAAALWYARRSGPELEFRSKLPTMTAAGRGGVGGYYYAPSDEISLRGARLGEWRFGFTALWSFNKRYMDEKDADINLGGVMSRMVNFAGQRDADADAWLIDIAAARPAGKNRAAGLRFRAFGCYDRDYSLNQNIVYYYEGVDFDALGAYYSSTNISNFLDRRIAFDLQGAFARTDGGRPVEELAVTISLYRLAGLRQVSSAAKEIDLDEYDYVSQYREVRSYDDDSRDGDLWSAEASYRRALPGGLRLYAGGSFAAIAFEGTSEFRWTEYYWATIPKADPFFDASLDGDGSVIRGALFARAGRAFSLHPSLDIHLTVGGAFARSECEMNPLSSCSYGESGEPAFAFETIVAYSSADTRARATLPLSIDFHPASYFSYFAAFIPSVEWRREIVETPLYSAFVFGPPSASKTLPTPPARALAQIPFGDPLSMVENRTETFSTGHALSCGFSIRLRDRFSVDLYTGSNVVPSSWNGLFANVSYIF